ncbi:MAG: DUF4760 domain-containing protein [Luteibacter sp.]|uniref:DUF4760 domain-containing protein n=1 Tax=unclassified Luteibacter TaxID=2620188 RepID=UPI00068EF394|nr:MULTISPECIES: DUF4760 domain-containing protein [unclassified Luteibacter]MDQ7997453.1 DUF4760 domain-containing protein [Luteibacter sp.]MDQ8048383.1 DUF4760 domain-containing protein [Luteibacter sp.]
MFHWILDTLNSGLFRNVLVAIGVGVAVASVLTARSIARKKQSADLLLATRNDVILQNGARKLKYFVDANDRNVASLALPENIESEEAVCIRYFLNHFEAVSIGIQAGIYDEAMLKKTWYSVVVTSWERARPLVNKLRERFSPTALQEYEWLHGRWKKSPLSERG